MVAKRGSCIKFAQGLNEKGPQEEQIGKDEKERAGERSEGGRGMGGQKDNKLRHQIINYS